MNGLPSGYDQWRTAEPDTGTDCEEMIDEIVKWFQECDKKKWPVTDYMKLVGILESVLPLPTGPGEAYPLPEEQVVTPKTVSECMENLERNRTLYKQFLDITKELSRELNQVKNNVSKLSSYHDDIEFLKNELVKLSVCHNKLVQDFDYFKRQQQQLKDNNHE